MCHAGAWPPDQTPATWRTGSCPSAADRVAFGVPAPSSSALHYVHCRRRYIATLHRVRVRDMRGYFWAYIYFLFFYLFCKRNVFQWVFQGRYLFVGRFFFFFLQRRPTFDGFRRGNKYKQNPWPAARCVIWSTAPSRGLINENSVFLTFFFWIFSPRHLWRRAVRARSVRALAVRLSTKNRKDDRS